MTTENKETILHEALAITDPTGQRRTDYGGPFESFSDIAKGWSMVLGTEVTPEQVTLCMIQVKVARAKNGGFHRDSFVAIAGYARCAELLADHRAMAEQEMGVNAQPPQFAHADGRRCSRATKNGPDGEPRWIVVLDEYRGDLIPPGRYECQRDHANHTN